MAQLLSDNHAAALRVAREGAVLLKNTLTLTLTLIFTLTLTLTRREGNAKSAAANLGANLGVALLLLLAFTHVEALQALTTLDANKNGVTELSELVAYYAGQLGM